MGLLVAIAQRPHVRLYMHACCRPIVWWLQPFPVVMLLGSHIEQQDEATRVMQDWKSSMERRR
jgi:hypothetical protein